MKQQGKYRWSLSLNDSLSLPVPDYPLAIAGGIIAISLMILLRDQQTAYFLCAGILIILFFIGFKIADKNIQETEDEPLREGFIIVRIFWVLWILLQILTIISILSPKVN